VKHGYRVDSNQKNGFIPATCCRETVIENAAVRILETVKALSFNDPTCNEYLKSDSLAATNSINAVISEYQQFPAKNF
jgi:hypothetical protein